MTIRSLWSFLLQHPQGVFAAGILGNLQNVRLISKRGRSFPREGDPKFQRGPSQQHLELGQKLVFLDSDVLNHDKKVKNI